MADFPVLCYHSPFMGLGSEDMRTDNGRSRECGFDSKGESCWGSEGGSGNGAEVRTGLDWKGSLGYCGSHTEVKLASGSESQGLCSSSRHWNLCSPVSVSGSQTTSIRFCFKIPSSVFIAAVPLYEWQAATSAISTDIIFRDPKLLHQLWSMCARPPPQATQICHLYEKNTRKHFFHNAFTNNLRLSFFFFFHSTNYQEGCLNYWNVENPNHIFVWLTVQHLNSWD